VTVGAYLFAHERLAAAPSLGVAVLALGLISLALSGGVPTRKELPAVAAAVMTGLTIASYSVIDGLGVRHAHDAFAYTGVMFLLHGPVFPIAAATRRDPLARQRPHVILSGLCAGVLSVGAYTLVLWAQTRAPLAIVASLRETSVIFAALIGAFFFNERFGARRTLAAVAVAAGIILISV
jgi:drug/metabolite transporter (DMT)-like permease